MANANFPMENSPFYEIPPSIKIGDFRDEHGGPDPYFGQASLIAIHQPQPIDDLDAVVGIQRELLRARAAFNDIQSKEEPDKNVVAEPYKVVTDYFGRRIDRILAGERLE